jgi:hypothetical protein
MNQGSYQQSTRTMQTNLRLARQVHDDVLASCWSCCAVQPFVFGKGPAASKSTVFEGGRSAFHQGCYVGATSKVSKDELPQQHLLMI